ncbi:MAG TPA: Glu-tRNA(Gln) amidotransferase subunit GatD, partial [Thermoplasmatales archaeon]|nr:Glu-tRNA(Gln) amidotransferase subunit GatD [Thermoplasmatales archaeon]
MREKLIKDANAEIGDTIKVIKRKRSYVGILMPSHEFSDDNIIVIKLKNGYNIGIEVDENTKLEVLEKGRFERKKVSEKTPFDPNKPTISILGTGGTIASYVDYRTGAVHPATSPEELAYSVPEIFDICNVRAKVVFQLLSENIGVENWKTLAREIAREFNKNKVSGIVVSHGTDTMGYTSAALSFMLRNLPGPVVLVGAQRSSDRPSSDAYQNLMDASLIAAKSDIGEVVVAMHGETSDTFTSIHRGTRVRKFHTSRRDAFKSVNAKPIGRVEYGEIIIEGDYKRKCIDGEVLVDDRMEEDVSLVYFHPGIKPDDIPEKRGIVLMGTGLGHVSSSLLPRLKSLIKNGTTVV